MSIKSTGWRWKFHYVLSRKLITSNLSLSPNVKLVRENDGNVTGFEIGVETPNSKAPEQYSDIKARTMVQKLSAKSEHAISCHLSGHEGIPNDPNKLGRVTVLNTHVYNIEGAPLRINNVDLTDANIDDIITSSNKQNNLQHIYNAISHFCSGRYKECITAAFMAIEGNTGLPDYFKYKCIRNIVNHKEDQQWYDNTVRDFDKYFKSSDFDFEVPHIKSSPIIVLDFESPRTLHALKKVSHDLITEAKRSLNL